MLLLAYNCVNLFSYTQTRGEWRKWNSMKYYGRSGLHQPADVQ